MRTSHQTRTSDAQGDLYVSDFHQWALAQANLIRAGQLEIADLANIAEEIESLGRTERAELESAYRLVCLHLLKRMYQPQRKTRSWTLTIVRERLHAERVLRDNPSLGHKRAALFLDAYKDARKEAAAETRMPIAVFPEAPAFTLEQLGDEHFGV